MSSFQIAKLAWQSALVTLRTYPMLAVGVLGALLVLIPLADLADGAIAAVPGMAALAADRLVWQIVWGLAAASLAMATHRLVILDDRADHPIWRLPSQYLHFALWTLPYPLATAVAHALSDAGIARGAGGIALFLYLLASPTIVVIGTRMSLLFPAIAVDDREAGFALSWRITRGHVWKMISAGLVAAIPMLIATGIELFIASKMTSGGLAAVTARANATGRVYALLVSLTSVLFVPVFAAVLSRFYQLYRHAPALDAGRGMVADGPSTA